MIGNTNLNEFLSAVQSLSGLKHATTVDAAGELRNMAIAFQAYVARPTVQLRMGNVDYLRDYDELNNDIKSVLDGFSVESRAT